MKFQAGDYPTACGVYIMRDGEDEVIYVGKARNLRQRLRSYFAASGDNRGQVAFLRRRVARIETMVTDTEKEALILENTLIKEHRPRYNIHLRDDKTYISIRCDPREPFPGLQLVRQPRDDGAYYFGPYASAAAVRATLKQLYQAFPLRHYPWSTCRRRQRPCLFYQINQCSAPCTGQISAQEYQKLVQGALSLLQGRPGEVAQLLQQRMQEASAQWRFEEAARLRDRLQAIEATLEKQKVVSQQQGHIDVIGWHKGQGRLHICILFVRHGHLLDKRSFPLTWELPLEELLEGFLQQFYSREGVLLPDELLLPLWPEAHEGLQAWLNERKGRQVHLRVPQRGDKAQLLEMAHRNAASAAEHQQQAEASQQALLGQLQQALGLKALPQRIECFDISTIQGRYTVGSLAAATHGELDKSRYRRYRISQAAAGDDYSALAEVLSRRIARGHKDGDLPDLWIIDGGKGQLEAVLDICRQWPDVQLPAVVGMAKSRVKARRGSQAVERTQERIFLPGRKNPVTFRDNSPVLFLLQRLRDEAHRFAISYHRRLRGQGSQRSRLAEIPGIGPKRQKQLLRHFGSLKSLSQASLQELQTVPGLPKDVAQQLYKSLRTDKE